MKRNIDFIGRKHIWFSISGAVIALGLIVILWKGLNFGIEFKGGNLFDLKFKDAPKIEEVRKAILPLGLGASTIQPIGEGTELLIRTPRLSRTEQDKVVEAIKKSFGVKDVGIVDVGPGWGSQVTNGAIKALIASLVILLIYISIRFEYKMAFSAIAAVFHDILVAAGVYAVVGAAHNTLTSIGLTFFPREITPNTIAAFLTIIGYSLYDTMVVFHRIKENTQIIGKRTYSEMANDSLNQVLMRSINTNLVALIPVFVLLLVGGQTLKDFAFALLIGFASGTYSTIFISTPVLSMWKEMEPRYKILRERYAGPAPAQPAAVEIPAEQPTLEAPTSKPKISKKRRKKRSRR